MAQYQVLKRMKLATAEGEKEYMPGQRISDPHRAALLVNRGYLQPLRGQAEEPYVPTYDEAIAAGYTPEAAASLSGTEPPAPEPDLESTGAAGADSATPAAPTPPVTEPETATEPEPVDATTLGGGTTTLPEVIDLSKVEATEPSADSKDK